MIKNLAQIRLGCPAFIYAALSFALAGSVCAQPALSVTDIGLNGNSNREWLVEVTPDASLFTGGQGSIAAELAFEVTTGSLVSVTRDAELWPFENPGNDPFTGSVSFGVNEDVASGTVFAALGSNLFSSGSPASVFTIETAGSGLTELSWGGHTLLPGQPEEYIGSRLAQGSTNFDNFTGTATAGGGGGLVCDADGDGSCDPSDIDALYAEFGNSGPLDLDGSGAVDSADITLWLAAASDPSNPYKTASGGDVNDVYVLGDVNLNGDVDSTDLGQLLNSFGDVGTPSWTNGNLNGDVAVDSTDLGLLLNSFGTTSASAVPEPSAVSLLWLGLAGFLLRRRTSRG